MAQGVRQARPRNVAPADVEVGGAERAQPGHLRVLVAAGAGQQVGRRRPGALGTSGVRRNVKHGPVSAAERSTACSSVTSCTVQSSARPRNRAMARGSAQSATTAAIGPVSRCFSGRSTRNSLPTGSARTVHGAGALPRAAGCRAERPQPCEQLLVVGSGACGEVEVHTVLSGRPVLGDRDDVEADVLRMRPDQSAGGPDVGGHAGVVGLSAERLRPGPAERRAVESLDDHMSGAQRHAGDAARRSAPVTVRRVREPLRCPSRPMCVRGGATRPRAGSGRRGRDGNVTDAAHAECDAGVW